jgi:hypothetical protein
MIATEPGGGLFELHPSSLSLITAGGAPGWTRKVADVAGARAGALITDSTGNPIIAGDPAGTAEFEGGKLLANGPRDVFVSEFDPDGNERWTVPAGGDGSDWADELASSPSGELWLSGWSGKLEQPDLVTDPSG